MWKQETRKESTPVKDETILKINTKGKTINFKEADLRLEGKMLDKKLKPTSKQVKECYRKVSETKRLEQQKGNTK